MDRDETTSISELRELLLKFRDERDWEQFHDPKNLAEAISIEAAEMLELFLWKKPEEVEYLLKSNKEYKRAIEDEFADIICFLLSFSNIAKIDVTGAVAAKIETNRRKYPVEKAKGSAKKYDQL